MRNAHYVHAFFLASVTLGFSLGRAVLGGLVVKDWHQFLILDGEGLFSCFKRFLGALTSHTSVQNTGILFIGISPLFITAFPSAL